MPKKTLPKEKRDEIAQVVRVTVRAGYDNLADCRAKLFERLLEGGDEQLDPALLRREIAAALEREVEKLAREAKGWATPTDNDRLDQVFAALEERYGIIARQDFWCCQTCGNHAMGTALAARQATDTKSKKKVKGNTKPLAPALGYVYFHNQDTERAVEGGGLFFAYGAAEYSEQGVRAVGRLIVAVLADHGLKAKWDGRTEKRIHLPMKWRRPLPRRSFDRREEA